MKLVYSPQYEVDVGRHVFNTAKYRLVIENLLASGAFTEDDIAAPEPASDDDIRLVHTPEYVDKLKTGTLSPDELALLEIGFSPALARAAWLWAGGSILAGRLAAREGACFHNGGGWHHAFPDHGEGFCVINDHAVAIRRLIAEGVIASAIIVDCDVHQANGTAVVFAADKNVMTFSIHQESNYPYVKPPSDLDVGLPDETGDEIYLARLEANLIRALDGWRPDLMFYVAGADTYKDDQLGGLNLTIDGMKQRDQVVCHAARHNGIPVAVVLAGGYASRVEDVATIHSNTAIVMKDMLG